MKIRINSEIIKIIISSVLFIISLFFKENDIVYFVLLILSYMIVAYDIFIEAFKKLLKGYLFDESTLMIIATISAFIIGEYPEAVMVMLLFQFGEYLSDMAVNNSKDSIVKLMDLRSDYVNLKKGDKIEKVDVKEAKVGDVFIVKPFEKIPLDGVVIEGVTSVDSSSLTGESVPIQVQPNSLVLSGYMNGSGLISVKATSDDVTSTASKIINLLENSNEKKTVTEKFITRFSRIYTPIIVILAILLVLVPFMFGGSLEIYNALVFLVTACPCALVISVPLGFFCGVGRASKEGILIKGSDGIDGLAKVEALVLDKTGTITEGKFEVREVVSENVSELLRMAACCEYYSNHPIANSIVEAYDGKIDEKEIKNYEEISGYGVRAIVYGKDVIVGSDKLMVMNGIDIPKVDSFGTIVFVSLNGKYLGYIGIYDKVKDSALDLVSSLKKLGIEKIFMLSGDNEDICRKVCEKVNISEYYSKLLPTDKVMKLKKIKKNYFTAFVGDGINDAPVIKEADLGISMGGIGSDAAMEAAGIIIMHDNLSKIPLAIKIARVTQRIVKFNIIFALVFKFLMLILAYYGLASIWMAVFADVGVTLLAVLNALRIMRKKI